MYSKQEEGTRKPRNAQEIGSYKDSGTGFGLEARGT